jgi:Spy/CpxP family protein refolding chaperone
MEGALSMPRTKAPAEHRQVMAYAQTISAAQKLLTGVAQAEEAERIVDKARERAVKAIVDAAPLLTAEQREQLRPILAGTIPADVIRADSTAA